MGRVQPHAPLVGLAGLRHQFAVGVQHPAGIGGEVVGYDVALLQDGQQLTDDVGVVALLGVADVDHQPDSGLLGGPLGYPGHLHAHYLEGRRHHSRLDPGDDALVGVDGLNGVVEIYAGRAEYVRRGGQPGAADVEEADDFGVAVGQDVTGEPAEGVATGTAGVHHGGHPGPHAADVGVYAVGVDPGEDVGVQVNQARRHHLALDLHHLRGLGGLDIGSDAGNLAVLDGYVVDAVDVLGRVNHRSALDQKVVHRLYSC